MAAPDTSARIGGVLPSPSRLWRMVRTGAAFAFFGFLGLFTAFVGVPLVRLVTRDPERKERRIQRLVQRLFGVFCGTLEGLGLARITWSGAEHVAVPGRLIVANHPTLIDAVAIMASMPQAICVAKEDTFSNPFLRGSVRAAGYVTNRDGPAVVEACAQAIRDGKSLLLFPEGSRSPLGGLRDFKRGAAHVALRSECEIVVVSVTCEPRTLMKDQAWWDVPDEPFHLHVRAEAPLRVGDLVDVGAPRPRAARALTDVLRDSIERGAGLPSSFLGEESAALHSAAGGERAVL